MIGNPCKNEDDTERKMTDGGEGDLPTNGRLAEYDELMIMSIA